VGELGLLFYFALNKTFLSFLLLLLLLLLQSAKPGPNIAPPQPWVMCEFRGKDELLN
jgi:hypothetical protein